MYYFFCQAEDGIRVYKVTGVQTCALPIWQLAYYLVVSTEEKWSALMIRMIADLNNLESEHINDEVLDTIRKDRKSVV